MTSSQWDRVNVLYIDKEVVVQYADIKGWESIDKQFKNVKNKRQKTEHDFMFTELDFIFVFGSQVTGYDL